MAMATVTLYRGHCPLWGLSPPLQWHFVIRYGQKMTRPNSTPLFLISVVDTLTHRLLIHNVVSVLHL